MDYLKNNLIDACKALIETADDTGCSDDLTVVGTREVEKIKTILKDLENTERDLLAKMYQYGGG